MDYSQAASFGTFTRATPISRRATFALQPVDALPRLAERIDRLAERSLEANPFFLPEFLEPAMQAFGSKGLRLAIVSDRDELLFFAPVQATGATFFRPRRLRVWTHPYAPLGSPLIDREAAPQVVEGLIDYLRSSGRRSLTLGDLPLRGPTARALRAAGKQGGRLIEAARQGRPVLHSGQAAPDAFEQMISAKHRRELDRQLRRLCDTGAVSILMARTPAEVEAAFATFVALEDAGWKGARGTALNRDAAVLEFGREAVRRLAERGAAAIDVMRVGEKPIAALIRFDHGGLSIPWKIAYDEAFAASSPGKQLICDATRRWLSNPSVARVDPICEENNPLMTAFFKDSEPYGALTVTAGRWDIGAHLGAGLTDLRQEAKRRVKAALKRPRSATKPAGGSGPKPKV